MRFAIVRKQKFTNATLVEAARLVAEERHPVGVEWREYRTGLLIRFTTAEANLCYRDDKNSLNLGEVREAHVTLELGRHIAAEVKSARRQGRNVPDFVRTFLDEVKLAGRAAGDAQVAAVNASQRGAAPTYGRDTPWTFERLVEEFLERKLAELKSAKSQKLYASYLRHDAFKDIAKKRVPELGFMDLFDVMQALTPPPADGKRDGVPNSTTMRAIHQARDMLSWAKAHKPRESGLGYVKEPWWLQLKVDWQSKKRRRTPTPQELMRTLIAIERERARPGDGLAVTDATLAAFEFTVRTGQRDGAVVRLERDNVRRHPTLKDWRVAHWSEAAMKGELDASLAHAIPLPPEVVSLLERLWAKVDPDARSRWAFPGRAPEAHVSSVSINQLWLRMRGGAPTDLKPLKPAYQGKPGPKPKPDRDRARPNLFESYGVPYYVPHDIRTGLATLLINKRQGRAASAILAHKLEVELPRTQQNLREIMADVTSEHYSTAQQISLKTSGMKIWAKALADALAAERCALGAASASPPGTA